MYNETPGLVNSIVSPTRVYEYAHRNTKRYFAHLRGIDGRGEGQALQLTRCEM